MANPIRARATLLLILVAATWAAGSAPQMRAQTTVTAYASGHWFTGTGFEDGTFYVTNSTLTRRRPGRVDESIDLAGGYVVPPYGEAHNHNVDGYPNWARVLARYIEHGIFYVKNPDNLPQARAAVASTIDRPSSIDVSFANGGWTDIDGHPAEIVKRQVDRGAWSKRDGDGGFYWSAASPADIERKWPLFLAQRPQFVKAYLLFSEEYARRRDGPTYFGWKGLDPQLLPDLVRRAHAAGLRVAVHIETAADFHTALMAGVDEVNHMPGFRGDMQHRMVDESRFEVTDADAALAARNETVVVTTLQGASEFALDGPEREFRLQLEGLHRRNLQRLRQHQVRVAIGSDAYDVDAVSEAMYVNSLGVFTPGELLRMWTEVTAKTIFPDRHIGVLEEGAEASFLVLRGNPLIDFAATQQIVRRVKQGSALSVTPR